MLSKLLENHVLSNLAFVLVLLVGILAYQQMPREQDPTVNFNWLDITTIWPGASPEDVEKLITDPLEEAVENIPDVKFAISTSREGYSNLVIRFRDLDARLFDKRVSDVRREIQNKANEELPDDAEEPVFFEVTSSNAFPTATLVVVGEADDETLRRNAMTIKKDLERIKGVDHVFALGLQEPELHVKFDPQILQSLGATPALLADTVQAHFRDTPAGSVSLGEQQWLVRLVGTDANPGMLAAMPLVTGTGVVPIDSVAEVSRARRKPVNKVRFEGKPATLLSVNKREFTNTLELLDRLRGYISDRNLRTAVTGVRVVLVDDQTPRTRKALEIMETNALYGLIFVMGTVWLFLGWKIALYVGLGIPFTLAGGFWILSGLDYTVNVAVLLGVVIALGMLVDDAIVVVEAIYYRLRHGMEPLQASIAGVKEVLTPVTASVLTTVAAFLPLSLMPGILGQFMRIIPITLTVMLLMSLVEAFWILPGHAASARKKLSTASRSHRIREAFNHWLRVRYALYIGRVLRHPVRWLLLLVVLLGGAVGAVSNGVVRVEWFAKDPVPLFYVNVEMPVSVRLDETLRFVEDVEEEIRTVLKPRELRAMASYAGQMFGDTGPLVGEHRGQVIVSLNEPGRGVRNVDEVVKAAREAVKKVIGPKNVSFFQLSGGPPTAKPISIKVRGRNRESVRGAADALLEVMGGIPGVTDISDDDASGKPSLVLRLKTDAVQRSGLNPATVARNLRLLVDGEVVTDFQVEGEKTDVRVKAQRIVDRDIESILDVNIALPGGGTIPLRELVESKTVLGQDSIRHYNFRLAITLEADLDKTVLDTVAANERIKLVWQSIRSAYPDVDLDMSGELEDIQESLDSMKILGLLGIGLVYLILGTQFHSFWQPFLILSTLPMAFVGVVVGLLVTDQPLSLFTLYGMVALGGIAVNSAIVLIDTANTRLASGMGILHATVFAARRRLIPVVITSITTIAGLFSLAAGLGGKSLLWGPVASVIVWGLGFSTLLTLTYMPLFYRIFMFRNAKNRQQGAAAG